jgi:hypothetical protein
MLGPSTDNFCDAPVWLPSVDAAHYAEVPGAKPILNYRLAGMAV